MRPPSFTAAEWQERARRVRAISEYLADPSAKSEMAMLARAYEQLATEAALREPRATVGVKPGAVH